MSAADRGDAGTTMSFEIVADTDADDDGGLPTGTAGYAVKLPVFEGPLDLLLHLIRQNEVEIAEISISEISNQYLLYLELMQDLNLDVAAEYLVMAATLALIKSRMLLPSEEEDELGDEGDPRALLIQRLLEYERYKEVAEQLGKRRLLGRDVFSVVSNSDEALGTQERELEVGLFELIDAFRLVLERTPTSNEHQIESEPVSVRDRMIFVMERLESEPSVEFNQIFEVVSGEVPGRPVIVATFLAILELARLTAVALYQGVDEAGAPAGAIRLRAVEAAARDAEFSDPTLNWRERISDLM
jgi:segregation and condensation protein A